LHSTIDYFLGLIRDLFEKIIDVEVEKPDCIPGPNCRRKSPHDLRYDLAMSIVILIDTLINHFGDFTSNETKIGLGFDRFMQMSPLR
jgi:hypothetical protein